MVQSPMVARNQETTKPKLSQWSRKASQALPQMFESHEVHTKKKHIYIYICIYIYMYIYNYIIISSNFPQIIAISQIARLPGRSHDVPNQTSLRSTAHRQLCTKLCHLQPQWWLRSETFKRGSSDRLRAHSREAAPKVPERVQLVLRRESMHRSMLVNCTFIYIYINMYIYIYTYIYIDVYVIYNKSDWLWPWRVIPIRRSVASFRDSDISAWAKSCACTWARRIRYLRTLKWIGPMI